MSRCTWFSKMWLLVLLSVVIVAGCGSSDSSSSKAITAYSLDGVSGTVNETAKSISVTMPYGKNVTALVATYSAADASVQVGSVNQTSGITPNNFSSPVTYLITAADGTTATYSVTVTIATISAKALTAYSFAGLSGAAGIINEAAKTVAVTVPNGTNVTALVATFTTNGNSVKVGTAIQANAVTANSFTTPVSYTVTAADGSTAVYTVTVTVAPATAKSITAFSFAGFSGAAGIINEAARTIAVTVPFGTDKTVLVATFTTSGSSVNVGSALQTSKATANNFTAPVAYTVKAADGSTALYTVTVTVAPNSARALTAFSFVGYNGAAGIINESAKSVAVTVPSGTNVTALVATFTTSGNSVKVGTTTQTSAATANNFTGPVAYTVSAADGSSALYTVTVTVASSSSKAVTAYSFAGFSGAAGIINETARTIAVTVPNGTAPTALVATFTTSGNSVTVGTSLQTSAATVNDFTAPVVYTVTAADASTVSYTVTVTVLQAKGPAAVNLGTAGNFVILAKSGVSTTGTTAVVGNIGLSPAAATFVTGFSLIADPTNTFSSSSVVIGNIYASNYAPPTPTVMTTAIGDMETAFTDAAGRSLPDFTELGAGDVSGMTLVPGLYKWGTGLAISTAGVTLTGGANDVWIFQIGGDLAVSNSAIITLAGGAQAKNIFWQVSGQTTLGTAADFKGIILSQTLISLNTGAVMKGRALAQTAVTLNATAITAP